MSIANLIFTMLLIPSVVSAQATDSMAKINWPSEYEPSKSKFYVHNEIYINASPSIVWEILIDAMKWQSWYVGAKNVSFADKRDTVLMAGSVFRWETMGLKFESNIKQFVPARMLAWESKKKSIRGYHVWLIVPTENGCKVITDESQNGWLTFFEKTFQPNKLRNLHDIWLSGLKKKAELKNAAL